RAGNIKNPQFVGGGRIFGPVPRDYSFKLNKKVRNLARKSALTYKAKDNAIAVIEDFNFDTNKTKNYTAFLKAVDASSAKTLVVLPEANRNIVLAGRNVANTRIITADQINTYDVLNADKVLLLESAVGKIANLLTKES
ncbi:MAG: 50S ribosomal protein L4, partial [Bacteroidota bacterium]